MMFRTKKFLATAGMLCVLGLAATGCVGGQSDRPSTGYSTEASISGEIDFTTWWSYIDQSVIDGFEEMYPNVSVNLQFTAFDGYATKLQALASSGDLPDVMAVGASLNALVKANQVYDLKDVLASAPLDGDSASWGDSFDPTLLAAANSVPSAIANPALVKQSAVPLNAVSVAAVYNKEIFDKVGISVPKSFDDLLSNCTALRGAGYIPMSLTGAVWLSWWPQFGWDQTMRDKAVTDFDPTDPDFVKGFDYIRKLADAGCWDPSQVSTDIAAETSLFLQQRTAQFITVPENFLQSVVSDAKFDLGSYTLPGFGDLKPVHTVGGGSANLLAMSADTDNVAAAAAFMKYLTSEAVQSKLTAEQYTLPSVKIDVNSTDPLMAAYIDSASNGFISINKYIPAFTTAGLTTYKTEVLPRLVLGEITPEEAASQTAKLFQQ